MTPFICGAGVLLVGVLVGLICGYRLATGKPPVSVKDAVRSVLPKRKQKPLDNKVKEDTRFS